MANIIYIMGKSATGKDTIYKKIKEQINANSYVPYTTRPKREGEKQGVDYNFITKEQFVEFLKQNKVMEYRSYNTIDASGEKDIWTYATIDDNQWKRSGDFLTIGTLESYVSILEYIKRNQTYLRMIPVYITIDENERRKRALKRENKQQKANLQEMERRFKADNIDFSNAKLEQAGITKEQTFENYDLQKCIDSILNYIHAKTGKNELKQENNTEER